MDGINYLKHIAFLGLLITGFQAVAVENKLAVVNKSDNSISIIDIRTKKIIATLPTGAGPHELILLDDGRHAVSTDFVGGNSLTVFDLKSQKVKNRMVFDDYLGPHGIFPLKDSSQVLFTSGRSQHLVHVDVLTKKVISALPTKQNTTHMVAVDDTETFAFTTNIRSDSISMFDIESSSLIKQIVTESQPEAIRYHHLSNTLWYGSNKEGLVTVINPHSEEVIVQFDDFVFPYRILFNHEQTIALVPDFRGDFIRFIDVKEMKVVKTLSLGKGSGPQGITLHPNNNIAYVSLNLKNKIVSIDIDKQRIVDEYPTGNNPDGLIYF